ncbi:ABC transporter permease subunit [Oceanobacillus sp. HCA-5259]|uniref:ABC transporter permease n=1 Tax=Oceanobacillus sp. HCA-5259 TaxID=3134661 RepID=UPI0030BC0713
MFAITMREFKSLFKSTRSIIIIIFIFGITTGSAKLISQFKAQLMDLGLGDNAYVGGLMILLFMASPLFVTSISNSIVNKEIDSKTIRFLATKTSRHNIILGKFLGNVLFWFLCLMIALLLIIPFSKAFYFSEFLQSIIYVSYFIGLTIFLSTIIRNPSLTMFLGITISIILPILGIWGIFSENLLIKFISYLTPYFYYTHENTFYTYFVLIFTFTYLMLSLIVFKRRDL